ncbi:helix-turn-helix transcriptional regulator [Hutsoniella sourekii]|uniref:helix-turn-helix transcriptional regulator n=1 Tax=Hutsoniella sourekii TaxID=87650 RepID=UPI000480F443|nr:helix-turn-helix transcriptional regulator [Hutsoniella sourekii]
MNRVKELRQQAQLKQSELAAIVGIARQTLSLIENDRFNPSLDLCIKLAKALNTDLNTLFWKDDKHE